MKPDPHVSKIRELWRLKLEPWRAVDAQNGGLEAKQSCGGLWTLMMEARRLKMELNGVSSPWSEIHITLRRSRIRVRINVMRGFNRMRLDQVSLGLLNPGPEAKKEFRKNWWLLLKHTCRQ
jgi:hypothetical protein